MREIVERDEASSSYDAFLLRKVEIARISMRAGEGLSDDEVEAEFTARRAMIAARY